MTGQLLLLVIPSVEGSPSQHRSRGALPYGRGRVYPHVRYYLDVWRGYLDFSGRAPRREYWSFTLLHALFLVCGAYLAEVLSIEHPALRSTFTAIFVVYFLASLIPSIAVTVRRLHDIGYSAWWLSVSLVPAIGEAWLLILMCIQGTNGANQYGPDPRSASSRA